MVYFYSEVLAYAAGIIILRGQRNKRSKITSVAFLLMTITISAISLQAMAIASNYKAYDSILILILFVRQAMLLLIYHLIYDDDWLTNISLSTMAIMTVSFAKFIIEIITYIPLRLPIKGIYIDHEGLAYHSVLVIIVFMILKYFFKFRVDIIQRQEQHYIISLMGVNLWIFSLLGSYFSQQFSYNVSEEQLNIVLGVTSLIALYGVKFILEKSGEILLVSQYQDLERYLPALYETLIESKRSTTKIVETMLNNPLAKENIAKQLKDIEFYEVNLCKNPTINAYILMNYLQLKKQDIFFQTELSVNKEIPYKKMIHIFGILRRCIDYLVRIILIDKDKKQLYLYLSEQHGCIHIEFSIEATSRRELLIETSMVSDDRILSKDYQQLNEYVHIHAMEHRFIFEDNGIKLVIKDRKIKTFAGMKLYED
jgi:hypothetical protein